MSASYAPHAQDLPGNNPGMVGAYKIQPLRAFQAFRKLVEDKEDTVQVFEIIRALTGKSFPNGYQRLISSEAGGRQAFEHVELAEKFCDRAWLDSFPEGTVGRAYRDFLALRNFAPDGLAEESRKLGENVDAPHPVAWYARRLRDVHDVWHVLTGYGTDALGEASLVAFTYAQTRNPGLGAIAFGAAAELEKTKNNQPYAKAIWQGYRNGQRAAWLPEQDYLALLAEPLEAARKRLKIRRPTIYDRVPAAERNGYLNLM